MSVPWSDFYLALCSSLLFLSSCSLPGGQEQPQRLLRAWLFISPHKYYRSKGAPHDCSTPPLCPAHFTELFLWLSPPLDACPQGQGPSLTPSHLPPSLSKWQARALLREVHGGGLCGAERGKDGLVARHQHAVPLQQVTWAPSPRGRAAKL